MFTRPKSFSTLYGIQRSFLNLFYLITVLAIFWFLFYVLHEELGFGGQVIIPVSIAYLVIIVLIYSVIQVVSYIPANLSGAFDPMKNGIADGSIASASDLSERLADFLCTFFNFTFFDIKYAMVYIQGSDPVTSGSPGIEHSELDEFSGSLDKTTYFRKMETEEESLHIYLIPLIFGDRRLGYMAVGTRQKLWKIFIRLLDEFENDFVDDQVIHILNR